MSNLGKSELPPTAPSGQQPNLAYPPVGAMAPPGVMAPTGASGGEANAAYVPGSQQLYEAPPGYSQTVQPGGYPQPQPGYNTEPGYQRYHLQQCYPPQAAYPQAGGPEGSYAAGGYQAPPVPQQQVPAKPGMEPENVGYGATTTTLYPIVEQPQPTHTTSVIVMSSSFKPHPDKINDWDKGICGCCSSCGLCLLSWFCPCYVVGKYAEAMGHSCCLYGVGSLIPIVRCVAHVTLRTEIRNRRGIKGSEFGDFCYVCCCSLCSLVQEANEVRLMENQDMQRV